MKNVPFVLPPELRSEKSLLRSRAFLQLVDALWRESEITPGQGVLSQEALRSVPSLVKVVADNSPHSDSVAWLLGLLAEASEGFETAAVRDEIRNSLPVFLQAVGRQAHLAANENAALQLRGLLFLLGHFPEDGASILERLTAVLGSESVAVQSVGVVFSTASSWPERSKFVLTHLGAEASSAALDARIRVFERALVCPACHGKLDYQEHQILCTACHTKFGWCDDIPDLVMPECADSEQYPESVVGIYETQSRPRFVRVMAADWSGVITPSREEEYLARFLRPVAGPVVDLACGAGGWTNRVARQVGASNVIALDYSAAMLKACSKAAPGVSLVRASASTLPFADASLGGMNCSDALQALPDPDLAFAEASRCLRPGATFTVFTFREASDQYAYFQHRLPAHARILFSDAQIMQLANSTGFDVIDMGGPGHAMFFTVQKRE